MKRIGGAVPVFGKATRLGCSALGRARRPMACRRLIALATLAGAALIGPSGLEARAQGDPAALCDVAARDAARGSAVPSDVLAAIALVETGRADAGGTPRPWPWAVNIAGQGVWHASREDALRHAREALAAGVRNIDLGCFQINHRWHGHAFTALEEMIDPAANAAYAVRLLEQHYQRHGSWSAAAAAYHSATPVHARRYQARFDTTLARLRARPDEGTPVVAPVTSHTGPLLRGFAVAAPGSLFTAGAAASTGAPTPGALSLKAIR